MRLQFYKMHGEEASLNWPVLLGFVVMVPVVVVGLVELFWYKFTGGFSPLMGWFAFVASILILIRVIGESMARDANSSEWIV